MGTDIHAFIEFDHSAGGEPFSDAEFIRPFNEGELFWWRCYDLFNALGDGRNYHFDEARIEKHALYPPRGLPMHYGSAVMGRFFYIADDCEYVARWHPTLGTITNVKADELLASGKSFLGPPLLIVRPKLGEQSLRRISNPDWHSASWLTLQEVHESLTHFDYPLEKTTPEVRASFDAMATLESHYGKGHSRLVFWFDN